MLASTGMERSNSSWSPMMSIVSRLSTMVRRQPLKLIIRGQSCTTPTITHVNRLTCSQTRCSTASARRSIPHTPSTRRTHAGRLPSPHEHAPTTSSSDGDLGVGVDGKATEAGDHFRRRGVGSAGVRRGMRSRDPSQTGTDHGRGRRSA